MANMADIYVELLQAKFKTTECDTRCMKVGPMKFAIQAYDVEGVGRLSVMKGSAMFGMMKMDTLMLTPATKDAPLISYDRIFAMSNDTLIIEMYDTCVNSRKYPELEAIKEKHKSLPDRDPGEHWYDNIKCSESVSKKGKKVQSYMDMLAEEYFSKYLEILRDAPVVAAEEKQKKNREYVDGLINNGGPSTDQFVKAIGKEATAELFHSVLFGTKE